MIKGRIAGGVLAAVAWTASASAETAPAHDLARDIAAYYPFEVNAEDGSGNGYSGTATPAVSFGPGRYNTAAVFTTAGARVDLPDMGRYAPNGFTVSTWVNLKALASPGGSKKGLGTLAGRLYVRRDDGRLAFYFYYDSTDKPDNRMRELRSKRALSPGSWHQVTAVYNPRGQVFQFFIDGVKDSSIALNLGNARPQFPWSQGIGGEPASEGDYTLNGSLDDVLLYRRPLTQDDIVFLANGAGRAPSPARVTRSLDDPANCGEYNANPCYPCTKHFSWPPWMWGACQVRSATCHDDLVFRDSRCTCPSGQVHGNVHASAAVGGGALSEQQCFTSSKPAPVITVTQLPSTLDIRGYPRHLTGIKGFAAKVTHIESADFLVADGSSVPADCGRLNQYKTYACTAHLASCSTLTPAAEQCVTRTTKCSSLGITDDDRRALNYPLYTLEEWQNLFPTRLKVNANWFDIKGPPGFPHMSPCTDIFGYSVNQGQQVSRADNPDVVGTQRNYLDALVVIDTPVPDGTTHRTVRIVKNSEIAGLRNVTFAVGGFILVKDGKSQKPYPSSVKEASSGARTGVGLSADNQTLYIVVVQGGPNTTQMTAADLAAYMKQEQGARNIINLDNSGSSQFLYVDGTTTYKSEPGDYNSANQKVYRPIPTFFGIR
jgi:Concanavalin A-like lectin/glucanases superfamily/Phosphodiester glycosidase